MPRPLNLAYIADPNSIHTRRWAGWFAAHGHEVHLLIGDSDVVGPGLPEGIRLHRYRRFGQRRLPFVSSLQGRRAVRATLAGIGPDVVHGHYLTRYGWQARLSSWHPCVISPWGSDLFVTPRRSLRQRLWARATLRGADLVTVVSRQMYESVRAYGVPPERIETIHFGVDTDHFRPARDSGDAWRRRHGLEGTRIVFSPRAIRPIYRPDIVVEAFAALPEDTTLVCTGRNAEGPAAARFRADVERRDLAGRVRILDEIDDDDMLSLFQHAAVVVSVPDSDAVPISVLEAMACGTPVVASDLPGPREVLEAAGSPQLLAPGGSPDDTARAIGRVLSLTPTERASLGERLRDEVVRRADRNANMERMERLYLRLRGDPA